MCARVILEYDACDVLNVFSLPTLKDVVGHYKLWNEVMFWLNTNCVLQCFNTFHCL